MFTQSPYGFVKGSARGHHVAAKTPQSSAVASIKKENEDLKSQLAELAAKVDLLTAKKGKK